MAQVSVEEIQVGPFVFEYSRPGMTVAKGTIGGDGEAIGYCEIVTPDEWEQFVNTITQEIGC